MSDNIQPRSISEILATGMRVNLKQYAMFIALLVIMVFFGIFTNGTFLEARNLSNLLMQTSYIAVLAIGMVLIIVAGHIDLSVGFLAGLLGAIAAFLQQNWHLGVVESIMITLAVAMILGLWQGMWVAYLKVPAFIVTLSGMLIFKGLLLFVTGGKTLTQIEPEFIAIGQGNLPQLWLKDVVDQAGVMISAAPFNDFSMIIAALAIVAYLVFETRTRAKRIKYGFEVLPMPLQIAKMVGITALIGAVFSVMVFSQGIPFAILLLMALVLGFTFLTNKTVFGRHVYAIGGNKEAARLSGINIQRRTMAIFVIMALLSAVSGIIYTARLASATPSAGTLFELDAIAAAIVGGTSTLGGEGTIIGAIIGALVMASLNNGMQVMNVPSEYQSMIKGLILLLAVWFDIYNRRKRG